MIGFKEGEDRITFSIKDKPGALREALKPIEEQQVNIVSICSHLHQKDSGDEFIIRIEAPDIDRVLNELRKVGVEIIDVR